MNTASDLFRFNLSNILAIFTDDFSGSDEAVGRCVCGWFVFTA